MPSTPRTTASRLPEDTCTLRGPSSPDGRCKQPRSSCLELHRVGVGRRQSQGFRGLPGPKIPGVSLTFTLETPDPSNPGPQVPCGRTFPVGRLKFGLVSCRPSKAGSPTAFSDSGPLDLASSPRIAGNQPTPQPPSLQAREEPREAEVEVRGTGRPAPSPFNTWLSKS